MSAHPFIVYPALFAVGVIGGFLNTVAGGASLLTMPALVATGLAPNVANATNNLVITLQAMFSSVTYARRGFANRNLLLGLGLPAICGSVLGAWLVVRLPNWLFMKIVGVLMIGALVLVLRGRRTSRTSDPTLPASGVTLARRMLSVAVFFVFGMYGGFFGGGLGLIVLPVLVYFFHQDYITANGVKTGVISLINVTATVVFVKYGFVRYAEVVPMTAGMFVGATYGVRFAVAGGDKWIRALLIVVTLAAAAYFLLAPAKA
jgi:uncharacterized protein